MGAVRWVTLARFVRLLVRGSWSYIRARFIDLLPKVNIFDTREIAPKYGSKVMNLELFLALFAQCLGISTSRAGL